MEEKERYYYDKILRDCVIPEGLFEIKDREGNFYLIIENKKDVDTITNLLNQQDKRIKELEEELVEKKGLERALNACNRQNDEFADMIKKLVNEKEELKQQLKDTEESYNTMRYLNKTRSELLNLHKKN